jgi:hypothetical protein
MSVRGSTSPVAARARGRRGGALALAALALVAGGITFVILTRSPSPRLAVDVAASGTPTMVGPGAEPAVIRLAPAAREDVGDGSDVPSAVADGFDERRIVVGGVAAEGKVRGAALRDALLTHPGVYVRFRTERAKAAFLSADIRVPEPAYLPADSAPGIEIHALVDFIRLAGFEAVYTKPKVLIGPRQEGSAEGPR